jgi:DNA-binding transcriptional regulator YdaS (Cro superfamily)
MDTTFAISLAGTQSALARLLGITQAAVAQWGDKVPEARVWQLKVLRPEWFTKD